MSKEYIEINKETFPTPFTINPSDYAQGWNTCLNAVLRHKVADVAPVVHGEWSIVYVDTGHIDMEKMYKCSECGGRKYNDYKYCPNCGADMRGVHKDA